MNCCLGGNESNSPDERANTDDGHGTTVAWAVAQVLRSVESGATPALSGVNVAALRCALEQGRAYEPLHFALGPHMPAARAALQLPRDGELELTTSRMRMRAVAQRPFTMADIRAPAEQRKGSFETQNTNSSVATAFSQALRGELGSEYPDRNRQQHVQEHGRPPHRQSAPSVVHSASDASSHEKEDSAENSASLSGACATAAAGMPENRYTRWSEAPPLPEDETLPESRTIWGSVSEDMLAKHYAVNSWTNFDADSMARSVHKPLAILAGRFVERQRLVERVGIARAKLERFLCAVNDSYAPAPPRQALDSRDSLSRLSFSYVPYHNLPHACDVTQCMYHLLFKGEGCLSSVLQLDPEEQLAAIIAAAAHDMDHEGLSGEFYNRVNDVRALFNGFSSVNERHHIASCLLLTGEAMYDPFYGMSPKSRERLCSLVSELILATDLQQHWNIMRQFDRVENPHSQDDEPRRLTLKIALKAADVSHATHSRERHELWTDRLEAENWRQGDLEKELGHPIRAMADRDQPTMRSNQTGFFDEIVLPMLNSLVWHAPAAQPLLDAARYNRQLWMHYQQQELQSDPSRDDEIGPLHQVEVQRGSNETSHR